MIHVTAPTPARLLLAASWALCLPMLTAAFEEEDQVQAQIDATTAHQQALTEASARAASAISDAQRSLARERWTGAAHELSSAVALSRRDDLAAQAGAKRRRLAECERQFTSATEALNAATPGPTQASLSALAQSCLGEVNRLRSDIAALDGEIARLDRAIRAEQESAARAEQGLIQHTAERERARSRSHALARSYAESQARLDALVAELQSLQPSLLLPQAEPLGEVASDLPPPPATPPAPTFSASALPPLADLNLPEVMAARAREHERTSTRGDDVLEVETPPGTVVRAARAGDVVSAGPLEGFGDVVILAHGGGVLSITASVASPTVQAGDHVEAGAPLATAGELRETGAPGFHFEVRRGAEHLDPAAWLGTDDLQTALSGGSMPR